MSKNYNSNKDYSNNRYSQKPYINYNNNNGSTRSYNTNNIHNNNKIFKENNLSQSSYNHSNYNNHTNNNSNQKLALNNNNNNLRNQNIPYNPVILPSNLLIPNQFHNRTHLFNNLNNQSPQIKNIKELIKPKKPINILDLSSDEEEGNKANKDDFNTNTNLTLKESKKDTKESRYGKYGILNFSNLFNKLPEFRLWLKETKNYEDEKLEEQYYAEFIEKYNQANLPHKKYYDLAKYEAKSMRKKMKNNKATIREKFTGGEDEGFVFDDEGRKEYEKKMIKDGQIRKKLDEIYKNMDDKRLEEMREHAYQNKLMIQYYRTGHESSARDIHSKYYSQANPTKKKEVTNEKNHEKEED